MKSTIYFLLLCLFLIDSGVEGGPYDFFATFFCHVGRMECCRESSIRQPTIAVSDLKTRIAKNLFGQHVAVETVLVALEAHLNDKSPQKPLVISFHGWPGTGKTFLAKMIINSIFEKGERSSFVKYFSASKDFGDAKFLEKYKVELTNRITETLSLCERSIFLFDEVDRIPSTLLDTLAPFVDEFNVVDGVDQKKAIYILLGNVGGNYINNRTLQHWEEGKVREKLTFLDFHTNISHEAFKSHDNGLCRARLIQRHMIGHFVPFLPLERRHVMQCIDIELKALNFQANNDDFRKIADMLDYWPEEDRKGIYSVTGCRPVQDRVRFYVFQHRHRNEL